MLLLMAVSAGVAFTHPIPIGIGHWITDEDCPTESPSQTVSGAVGYRLNVGKLGHVTECEIVASSGSAALDSKTCSLLLWRARFIPKKDDKGVPMASVFSSSVSWMAPPRSFCVSGWACLVEKMPIPNR